MIWTIAHTTSMMKHIVAILIDSDFTWKTTVVASYYLMLILSIPIVWLLLLFTLLKLSQYLLKLVVILLILLNVVDMLSIIPFMEVILEYLTNLSSTTTTGKPTCLHLMMIRLNMYGLII